MCVCVVCVCMCVWCVCAYEHMFGECRCVCGWRFVHTGVRVSPIPN